MAGEMYKTCGFCTLNKEVVKGKNNCFVGLLKDHYVHATYTFVRKISLLKKRMLYAFSVQDLIRQEDFL